MKRRYVMADGHVLQPSRDSGIYDLKGEQVKLRGFSNTKTMRAQRNVVLWLDEMKAPDQAIGQYPVCQEVSGEFRMFTFTSKVRSVEDPGPEADQVAHTHHWIPKPMVGGTLTCQCGARHIGGKVVES